MGRRGGGREGGRDVSVPALNFKKQAAPGELHIAI